MQKKSKKKSKSVIILSDDVVAIRLSKKERRETLRSLGRALKTLNGGKNWIQSVENDGNGSYCMLGAIRHVDGVGENGAIQVLSAVLGGDGGLDYYAEDPIIDFNDSEGRRFRDVKQKFE